MADPRDLHFNDDGPSAFSRDPRFTEDGRAVQQTEPEGTYDDPDFGFDDLDEPKPLPSGGTPFKNLRGGK